MTKAKPEFSHDLLTATHIAREQNRIFWEMAFFATLGNDEKCNNARRAALIANSAVRLIDQANDLPAPE